MNEQTAVVFKAVGGRDLCLGLTMTVLSYQGERRALATVFGCSLAAGLSDAWTCWQHGPQNSWRSHAIGCVITVALSWSLME